MNNKSVVLKIGYPPVKSGLLKELTYQISSKHLAEGFGNDFLLKENMLQVKIPIIKRKKMKYVDFKGREWSVEKGDWISYQMLDKQNHQYSFNKSTLKIFFYIISCALLTVYFWLV